MPAAGASKVVPGAELSKTALGATWRPIQLQYGGNQEMPIFVGGEGGILTHEPGEGSPVFKSQDRRAAGPDTHTSACFIGFLKTFRSSFFRVFTTRAARSAASGSPDRHALACPCAEPARSCTLRCESPRTLFLVEGLPIRGSPMNLLFVTTPDSRESRMDLHQNARLTPRCRELLVGRVMAGRRRREVARELGVSQHTVRKWVGRFETEGSRVCAIGPRVRDARRVPPPRRCGWRWWRCGAAPDDSSDRRSTRAVALERGPDLSPGGSIAVIAARPRSVLPALRAGASRGVAALDIKKLGRMVKIGHRITRDPRDRVEGAGWEYVHVAIDDHSRAGACHARRRPPSRPRRRRLPRAIHRESPFRCPARHRAPSRSRERRNCSSKRAPGRCWTAPCTR